jgi:SAM-dependent methyltransferase
MKKMDEIAKYNVERWQALADADALFTRPSLDLTPDSAREFLDAEGVLGEVAGKSVLCLASGGGQQSAAFALLGADVTVFDISEAQLERDQQAAAHYGKSVRTVQGDMRDLSVLAPAWFDLVYQPFSIGYVPEASLVFAQVARVLRPGGIYFVAVDNPFFCGMSATDWNGKGYVLKAPYQDQALYISPDPEWVYARSTKPLPAVREARLYRHTLANTLNTLLGLGFALLHLSDSKHIYPDAAAEPGSWDHFVAYAPVYLGYWLRYQPTADNNG